MITMYLPNVYEPWERNTGVAARPVKPTLDEAMAVLDAEIEKVGKPALDWREEFGGAYARQGDLAYEVTPVQVDLVALDGVPKIRRRLCDAVTDAHNARTKKDRALNFAVAYAYATALRELVTAGPLPDGVAPSQVGLGIGDRAAETQAREWIGTDADRLLGAATPGGR